MIVRLRKFAEFLRIVRFVGFSQWFQFKFHWLKNEINMVMEGHSLVVRRASSDMKAAARTFLGEFDAVTEVLPKNFSGLIVDAGGYIGTAAIKLATLYPHAKILSIEACEANFRLLERNTQNYPNIRCVNKALSTKEGQRISVANRGTGFWGYTTVEKPLDNPNPQMVGEVEGITLTEIQAEHPGEPIGLLKIDIEGGEKKIFQESSAELSRIPVIVAELHDRIVAGCMDAFKAVSKDRWLIKASGEKYISLSKGELLETVC